MLPSLVCAKRKLSLITRFTVLRLFAFAICFLAMANPNRGWPFPFGICITTKNLQRFFSDKRNMFRKSSAVRSRAVRGNRLCESSNSTGILCAENLTTFSAACIDNSSTTFRFHSCAKTVSAFTFYIAWLICSFHFWYRSLFQGLRMILTKASLVKC